MKYFTRLLRLGVLITILSALSIPVAGWLVEKSASDRIYHSPKDIPHNKVGLLPGTAKILANGRINLYYKYRINAAITLFNAGKIDYVLVSGDNSTKHYDEPSTIKNDLIKRGIPARKIYLDYAGFRTLDSVVRSREIFGQQSITVISQQFHNERAIYIATRKGIDAIGFNARDVSTPYGLKIQLREKLARVKMVLDLLFGKQPKFLGERIIIP